MIDQSTREPTVAIYRTEILPLSETFIRDQAIALRRWHPVLIGERQIDKLPLMTLNARSPYYGPASVPQRAKSALARRFGAPPPGVMRVARPVSPQLVHAHFGFDGVEAWPIAQKLGVPLLVTLHGSDVTTHMRWFAAGRAGRRWKHYPARLHALARESRVSFVAVSGHIREAAIRAGLPASRIFVRHIGVDLSRFSAQTPTPGQRAPVILFVGRLVEKKGASLLLEAFAEVKRRVPDARLIIAGDGPLRPDIEAQARRDQGVTLTGAIGHDMVRQLMGEARVFCLPSITATNGDAEGLPLVLLEAQGSGVPVVTSARGGTTEGIADGTTGYAFAERDIQGLARHLTRLLTDAVLADRMGIAGPDFVAANHDIGKCTAELETLYDQIVGRLQ